MGAIEPYDNLDNMPSIAAISYGTFAMFYYEKKKPIFLVATANQQICFFTHNINSHKKCIVMAIPITRQSNIRIVLWKRCDQNKCLIMTLLARLKGKK